MHLYDERARRLRTSAMSVFKVPSAAEQRFDRFQIGPRRGPSPRGEGESFSVSVKCDPTGSAGQPYARPEAAAGCSLSPGERVRVRAGVKTILFPNLNRSALGRHRKSPTTSQSRNLGRKTEPHRLPDYTRPMGVPNKS